MDNELKIGEYFIPEDCTIKRVGNTIQVYKKKKDRLSIDEPRCKDCVHYVEGHAGLYYWTTKVCDKKPKTLSAEMERRKAKHKDFQYFKLFHAARKYEKPCSMFEKR